MSMNLHLTFNNSEGDEVVSVDLTQTPTQDSYNILGGETSTYTEIKQRYLNWFNERAIRYGWENETMIFMGMRFELSATEMEKHRLAVAEIENSELTPVFSVW